MSLIHRLRRYVPSLLKQGLLTFRVQELHDKANIDYDHVDIQHNPSLASLYEDALVYESGSAITSAGALATSSGSKTGRSPQGIQFLIRRVTVSNNRQTYR
jgi:ATP-dependent phosphoenolpyruvate carboxykinase